MATGGLGASAAQCSPITVIVVSASSSPQSGLPICAESPPSRLAQHEVSIGHNLYRMSSASSDQDVCLLSATEVV